VQVKQELQLEMPVSKTQAEIKAKAAVECHYLNPWNALTRMYRRKKHFCVY